MGKVVKIDKAKGKKEEKKDENKPKHFVIRPDSIYHKIRSR